MSYPPPVSPTLAQPPGGEAYRWFNSDDYPVAAIRREAQGLTVARLNVDATGRVTGCTIVSSSGDADLDRATCSVSLRRGRYATARAADGAPTKATVPISVRWSLPQDEAGPPAPSPPVAPHPRPGNWFERLLAAHHLVALATVAIAALVGRVKRWLGGPDYVGAEGWVGGDPFLPRRRVGRWGRLVRGRHGRLALRAAPVVGLALLFAWFGR